MCADELMPQVSLEQAAAHNDALVPELRLRSAEIRPHCFRICGRAEESSERAFAICTDSFESRGTATTTAAESQAMARRYATAGEAGVRSETCVKLSA